jgi:hypothetical protein
MAKDRDENFPVASSGNVNPKNYVVAVIDDQKEAEKVEQALREAGFGSNDIRVMRGKELLDRQHDVEQDEKKQNVFSRLAGAFGEGAEEGGDTATYMQEARKGHVILNVYAGKAEQADKISAILAKYHARLIKYYGNWSIANYPTPND